MNNVLKLLKTKIKNNKNKKIRLFNKLTNLEPMVMNMKYSDLSLHNEKMT